MQFARARARSPAARDRPSGRYDERLRSRAERRRRRHVADRAVVGPAAHDVAHREQAGDLAAVVTTRWRKPPRTIATAASSSDQSGAAKTMSDVRWSATRSVSGSCPAPIESSKSRSVRMPGPGLSGSSTTAAPTRRSAISRAASRSVWPGPRSGPPCSCRHVPACRLPPPQWPSLQRLAQSTIR